LLTSMSECHWVYFSDDANGHTHYLIYSAGDNVS
jgi:hypothetical protein